MNKELNETLEDLVSRHYEEDWFEFKENWFEAREVGE